LEIVSGYRNQPVTGPCTFTLKKYTLWFLFSFCWVFCSYLPATSARLAVPLEQAFLAESPDASEEAQVRTTGRNRLIFFWSHKWLLSLGRPYTVMHVYACLCTYWIFLVNHGKSM
jgi:hypothetical protein